MILQRKGPALNTARQWSTLGLKTTADVDVRGAYIWLSRADTVTMPGIKLSFVSAGKDAAAATTYALMRALAEADDRRRNTRRHSFVLRFTPHVRHFDSQWRRNTRKWRLRTGDYPLSARSFACHTNPYALGPPDQIAPPG